MKKPLSFCPRCGALRRSEKCCNKPSQGDDRLHTSKWQKTRRAVLAAHPICQDCNKAFACDVHHESYDDFFNPLCLRALCRVCHNKANQSS